jgi:hypothetical protein
LLHDIGQGVRILMKAAHPHQTDRIDTLLADALGAQLLRLWGLPDRICTVIEKQALPEFTPPDMIQADLQREVGILHIAHVLESLLTGEAMIPERAIYARDYVGVLGLPQADPEALFKDRILPGLLKTRNRLPEQMRHLIDRHVSAE